MIVNDNKLKKLIDKATVYCNDCPIYEVGDWTTCDKYRQKVDEDTCLKSCSEALLDWIQVFDTTEILELGADVVNDQAIVLPDPLPDDFKSFLSNVPFDFCESCGSSCPWFDGCPFENE